MIYPKRLIEVDLPIKRISAHARREKSIRHGHISTLHIWWARRPLAACRAVICAALWPDPVDELCPQAFRDVALEQMRSVAQRFVSSRMGMDELTADLQNDLHSSDRKKQQAAQEEAQRRVREWSQLNGLENGTPLDVRRALLAFIAWGTGWEQSTMPTFLNAARSLTQAAHEALSGESGTRPLVVDPFAGGGSIPLEALRVGADTFASDLNPVAVLLNKVVLEYIPKYGQRLADEVRKWGRWVKQEAERELAEFYPIRPLVPEELQKKPLLLIDTKPSGFGYVTVTDTQEHLDTVGIKYSHYVPISEREAHEPTALRAAFSDRGGDPEERLKKLGAKPLNLVDEIPVAYLWARTIQCEGPGCGVEIPLLRSLWLARKGGRKTALCIRGDGGRTGMRIEIIQNAQAKDVREGTIKGGTATCPCCGYTIRNANVRLQLARHQGGASKARLIAVMTTIPGKIGRFYRLPVWKDMRAVEKSVEALSEIVSFDSAGASEVPCEPIAPERPSPNARGLSAVTRMGMKTFRDLFIPRQLGLKLRISE